MKSEVIKKKKQKKKSRGEIPDSWELLKKPNPVQQGSASHQRSHSKNLGKEKHFHGITGHIRH